MADNCKKGATLMQIAVLLIAVFTLQLTVFALVYNNISQDVRDLSVKVDALQTQQDIRGGLEVR